MADVKEETTAPAAKEKQATKNTVPTSQPKAAVAEEKFAIEDFVKAYKQFNATEELIYVALYKAGKGDEKAKFTRKEAEAAIASFAKKVIKPKKEVK